MRGEGGVAGEGRVVGVPKFHSWGTCIMPLTNINSDWMSNASSGPCIILGYLFILRGSFKLHLGVYITSISTTLEDAHKRIVLQVYLGSNTLQFSTICR